MNQTDLPNETEAVAGEHTTKTGLRDKVYARNTRSVERSLSRAAVRELEAREHARYAAEDAEDEAVLAQIRAEMDAKAEERRVEAWDLAVARELASARRRNAWIDAHEHTAEVRRTMKAAQRQALDEYRPYEAECRAHMRHERDEQEEARRIAAQKTAADQALETSLRHKAWIDACEVAAQAKRSMRAAMKAARAERRATRAERNAAEAHTRAERNAIADARAAAIRKAVQERAVATAQRHELEREGASDAQIAAARERESELRAIELKLKEQARHERNEAEEALRIERNEAAVGRAMAEASMREAWLAARHAQAVEHRKMKAADRAVKDACAQANRAAEETARHERNDQEERRRVESKRLNTERELMMASLQEEYLDALAHERELWARTKEVDKPARAADLAYERAIAEQRRHERNTAEDAYQETAWNLRKERGYARAMEREAARETAQEAYEKMKAAMSEEA